MSVETVGIRPGVAILSMLKHLNYKPYYALAEFVDNSIDSFLKNEKALKNIHGNDFKLEVLIELNREDNKITIRDNAAGIDTENYQRAFRPAEIPLDNTKLSEFGMGMKSASCWFANKWSVRSTAIGESVEKTVNFDIAEIVNDTKEELEINEKTTDKNIHYTVVTLLDVDKKMPFKRGLSTVKRHLSSIYREFIRKGILVLKFNGETLLYDTPKILNSKKYDQIDNQEAKTIEWKKDVNFDFGGDFKVKGFVALMDTMSIKNSGFALFRRDRVIEGSADKDEGFRPEQLFKSVGSHTYKRLFGELHLEGFEVSHTKDGFQWNENMEIFLEELKEELKKDEKFPILKQADKYRVQEDKKNLEEVAKEVVDNTIKAINTQELSNNIGTITISNKKNSILENREKSYSKNFTLEFNGINWDVYIELSYENSIDDLIDIGEHLLPLESQEKNVVGIRLSLLHPFMINFIGVDKDKLEPFMRFVVALCLSEIALNQLYSDTNMTEIRHGINKLLKGVLARQV